MKFKTPAPPNKIAFSPLPHPPPEFCTAEPTEQADHGKEAEEQTALEDLKAGELSVDLPSLLGTSRSAFCPPWEQSEAYRSHSQSAHNTSFAADLEGGERSLHWTVNQGSETRSEREPAQGSGGRGCQQLPLMSSWAWMMLPMTEVLCRFLTVSFAPLVLVKSTLARPRCLRFLGL